MRLLKPEPAKELRRLEWKLHESYLHMEMSQVAKYERKIEELKGDDRNYDRLHK